MDPRWYIFKCNGYGLKYAIGISTSTGQVAEPHGPFECGIYNEVAIFSSKLETMLDRDEFIVADRDHTPRHVLPPRAERDYLSKIFGRI